MIVDYYYATRSRDKDLEKLCNRKTEASTVQEMFEDLHVRVSSDKMRVKELEEFASVILNNANCIYFYDFQNEDAGSILMKQEIF